MSLTKRAFNYAKPYKSSFITAIIFNLLYALFNVVALAFMMPILSVLFGEENNEVVTKPIYSGKLDDLKQFFSDYSAYYMNEVSQTEGPIYVLAISCVILSIRNTGFRRKEIARVWL